MSTTLSAMTAAELVAELERRQADRPKVTLQNIDPWFIHAGEGVAEAKIAENERNWIESMSDITAELDARCEKAGIMIDPEGYPVFFNFDHCKHFSAPKPELYASAEFLPQPQPVARVNVKAEDVRDLLSYLLTKGGGK